MGNCCNGNGFWRGVTLSARCAIAVAGIAFAVLCCSSQSFSSGDDEREYLPHLEKGERALVVEDLDGNVFALRQQDGRAFIEIFVNSGADFRFSQRLNALPEGLVDLLTREFEGEEKEASQVQLVPMMNPYGCLVYRFERVDAGYRFIQLNDDGEVYFVLEKMNEFLHHERPPAGISHMARSD